MDNSKTELQPTAGPTSPVDYPSHRHSSSESLLLRGKGEKPTDINGIEINRISVHSDFGQPLCMVDAYQVWTELLDRVDLPELTANFCRVHEAYPQDWVYSSTNRYGLIIVSDSATPNSVLYVASRHLRSLLTAPSGRFHRLRQTDEEVEKEILKASSMTWLTFPKSQNNITRSMEASDLRQSQTGGSPSSSSQLSRGALRTQPALEPALEPAQLVGPAQLNAEWKTKFRLMLLGILVSTLLVLGLLVWGWGEMAQTAIEQPGKKFIESLSTRATQATKEVLRPPRTVLNWLDTFAASQTQVADLTTPHAGYNSVTVSKATADPSPLFRYMMILARTYDQTLAISAGFADNSFYTVFRDKPHDRTLKFMMVDPANSTGYGHGLCVYQYLPTDNFDIDFSTGVNVMPGSCFEYRITQQPSYISTDLTRAQGWGSGPGFQCSDCELMMQATAPVFAVSTGQLLGQFLISVPVSQLSAFLGQMGVGSSVAFVVEVKADGLMYLVGASEGNITGLTATADEYQLLVSDSDSEKVRVAAEAAALEFGENYVLHNHTDGGNAWSDKPMLGFRTFTDWYNVSGTSGGSGVWMVGVMIPATDYYSFIMEENYIVTATASALILLVVLVVCMKCWFVSYNLTGIEKAEKWVNRATLAMLILAIFLYLYWLTTTQEGVDDVATAGLHDVGFQFEEWLSYRWQGHVQASNFTSGLQIGGFLPINVGTPATDQSLDKFLLRMLYLLGSAEAIYIGFEANGDFLGASYFDLQNERIATVAVRSSETGGDLVYYKVRGSGMVEQRDTSAEVARYKSYDARTTTWYKKGKSQGQIGGSQFGVDGLTPVYRFLSDYDNLTGFGTSIVQPYFTSLGASSPYGVIAVDSTLDCLTTKLQEIQGDLDFEDASFMVVETLGEVISRANNESTFVASNGVIQLLNSTAAGDDAAAIVMSMIQDNGDLINSQGTNELNSGDVISIAAAGTSGSDHVSTQLASALGLWSFLQVIPRSHYFDNMDDQSSKTFATLVFAFTFLFYVINIGFKKYRTRLSSAQLRHAVSTMLEVKAAKSWNSLSESTSGAIRRRSSRSRMSVSEDAILELDSAEHNRDLTDGFTVERNHLSRPSFSLQRDSLPLYDDAPLSPHPIGSGNGILMSTQNEDRAPPSPPSQRTRGRLQRMHSPLESEKITDGVEFEDNDNAEASQSLPCKVPFQVPCRESYVIPQNANPLELLELCTKLLKPMVKNWRLVDRDGSSIAERLQAKAVDYMVLANRSYPVWEVAALEARFGEDTVPVSIHKFMQGPRFQWPIKIVIMSFLAVELLYDAWGDSASGINLACAILLTVDALWRISVRQYTKTSFPAALLLHGGVFVVFWILYLASDNTQHMSGIMKPLMVSTKIPAMRMAIKVFSRAVYRAKFVFFLLFTLLAQAAILMLLLFNGKYEKSALLGTNAKDFLNSFVAMFVYITSGENWDQVVYPMYAYNKASSLFFTVFALVGILFVSSMLIAAFELSYSLEKDQILQVQTQQKRTALCCSFCLWTWYQRDCSEKVLSRTDFADLMEMYWLRKQRSRTGSEEEADRLRADIRRVRDFFDPIFESMDVDGNGAIDFTEFLDIFAVATCVQRIDADVLLGHRLIAARWEIEHKNAEAVGVEEGQLADIKKFFDKATHMVDESIVTTEGNRRVFQLRWSFLNKVLCVLFLAHSYILSLYGTDVATAVIYWSSCGLIFVYTIEMALRVQSIGGLREFVCDSLYPHSSWANVCQLGLTLLGLICAILYIGDPADTQQLMQALMSISLWRVFFIINNFTKLLYSFWHGMQPLWVYTQLLFVAFYMFSFGAWKVFGGTLDDESANFNSLGDSMLLMFQVFIGEGWHSIMQEAVVQRSQALVWFFCFYVLFCGMIFSNLAVGIVISIFQEIEVRGSTRAGEMDLIFASETMGKSSAEKEALYRHLGHLASLLHNPVMKSLAGLIIMGHKFNKSIIKDFDGLIEEWAATRIQCAFLLRKSKRLGKALNSIKTVFDQKSIPQFSDLTYETVYCALREAWDRSYGENDRPSLTMTEAVMAPEGMESANIVILQESRKPIPFSEAALHEMAREISCELAFPCGAEFECLSPSNHMHAATGNVQTDLNLLNRSWDFYTFVCWITPQIVIGHDLGQGKDLWTDVVLALNPPHYPNDQIISGLIKHSCEQIQFQFKPK